MRHPLEVRRLLVLVFVFSLIAACQSSCRSAEPKPSDVLSEREHAIELSNLRQMSTANKANVIQALDALQEAYLTATVSTDMEKIAESGSKANAAVGAAEKVIPNGWLKGAMISCNKALGHSHSLRLVHSGGLDANEPQVAALLEEIMIRYQLAGIPKYERPARVLAFANAHLGVANQISFNAGIISKMPE